MFSYIHTTSTLEFKKNERILLDEYIDNYLFSLIGGLVQVSFGIDTISKLSENIAEFKKSLRKDQRLFIDSGGYSIIKGDVSPRNLNKFIECYNTFLKNYSKDYCDYIFSLDIPVFLKYPEKNNVKFIKSQNYNSLIKSKNILDKNKELYNKWVFVWQFKLKKQYEIWKDLYNEIFEKEINLHNFAVGGLVGLRGITNIQFSPFIAMAFKCCNIVYNKNLNKTSLLHILGVYGLHDRFAACFLDRLFNKVYLKDKTANIEVSYDTINYSVSGFMRVRDLEGIILENNKYFQKSIINLEDNLKNMIKNQDVLNEILIDLENLKNKKDLKKPRTFALLNIIRQITIDEIIKKIVDEDVLLDLLLNSHNFNKFKNNAEKILYELELKYPFIFQNRVYKNLENFKWIYNFHDWWINGRSEIRLEKGIDLFIKSINFPFDLQP